MPVSPIATARRLSSSERFRTGLARFALATLAGLILAGVVHIVAVLAVPHLARGDALNRFQALGGSGRAEPIPDGALLQDDDPAAVTAVCSYDLSSGPVRVSARIGTLPLGLTLHRKGGGVIYAITDRAAIRGIVEFVIVTEEQRDERAAADQDGDRSVRELRVVSDAEQGLLVVRALAKTPSERTDAETLARAVTCGAAD